MLPSNGNSMTSGEGGCITHCYGMDVEVDGPKAFAKSAGIFCPIGHSKYKYACSRLQDSGKNGARKNARIFESLLTSEHFYCINYMDYHFNVCFFSVQTDALLTV